MSYKKQKIWVLSPKEGYDLLAKIYKKYHKKLDNWDYGLWMRFLPRNLNGKVIVDLGAGDCRLYKFFKNKNIKKYIAFDISEQMILKCKGADKKIICDLNYKWPIGDNSVDILLAFFVILHLKDLNNFFSEAYRVLKSGGIMISNHHIERNQKIFKLEGKEFKIKNYNRRFDEIEKIARYNFFKVDSINIPNGGGKIYLFSKNV